MEILINHHQPEFPSMAVLIGLGMIGSAIADALKRSRFQIAHHIPVDWESAEEWRNAGSVIFRTGRGLATLPSRISLIWSAGKTNFYSSEDEVARENRSFDQTLSLVERLQQSIPQIPVDIHFVSSAGGLFEGQKIVNRASVPAPKRPYGQMKQEQEQRLRSTLHAGEIEIYRPSSVYGPMVRPRRHGLINQLIANAFNRRTSVLDANVMALRDYVYSGDIGEYVARRILFPGSRRSRNPEHFLVSGRCASIFEVVAQIERATHLRVPYRFDENFGNSASITFSESVIPHDWRPSTLEVGIRQFMLRDRPQTRAICTRAGFSH